jgi:hypothetical protein
MLFARRKRKSAAPRKSHGEKVCTGKILAAALSKTALSNREASAWHRDLMAARKRLMPHAELKLRAEGKTCSELESEPVTSIVT